MSDAAEGGGLDLPTDEKMRRFWKSNLGRSIERGLSDPADVFDDPEIISGATVGVSLSKNPANDRRGSLGRLFERIADPSRPFPFDREFAVKRWELLAWLDEQRPEYCPSLIERQVILPAYRERLRREAEGRRCGNPSPQEPEAVALKVQKNLDVATLRSLYVHVVGYSDHGESYGLPPDKQRGLSYVWIPLKIALTERKFAGFTDKQTFENLLDYLESHKGLKRADVLDLRLDMWEWLLDVLPPPQEPEQTENTLPSRWLDDGPKAIERAFVWAGKRYEDIPPNAMRFLELLFEAEQQGRELKRPEAVKRLGLHLESESLLKRLFRVNRGRKSMHPVRAIVTGRAKYRLINRQHG